MASDTEVIKQLSKYAVAGTVGTLLIGYGLREFIRATGGGYYYCNHMFYQRFGATLTFLGW